MSTFPSNAALSQPIAGAQACCANSPPKARVALGIGFAGIALTAVGFFVSDPRSVALSWLVAVGYWTLIVVGMLGGFGRLAADLIIARPINTLKEITDGNLSMLDYLVKGSVKVAAEKTQQLNDQIQETTRQMASALPLVKEQLAIKIQCLQQILAGTGITPDQYNEKKTVVEAALPALKTQLHEQWGVFFSFQQNIHWLYYCEGLLVVTAVLMIVISLLTKAPDPKTVKYTYYGATPEEKAATKASWNAMDVVLSLIVVGVIVLFYIKFW